MTVWLTHIAYWIPKTINTYSEHVILIAFPLYQWLRERARILRYENMACLVSDTSFVVSLISGVNHYMHKDFAI